MVLQNIAHLISVLSNQLFDASIGIAMYPEHATTVNELLTRSDNFMYSAKKKGKNKIVMGDTVYAYVPSLA